MKYVLVFLWDKPEVNVLLIKKEAPNWQAGFLNGVGGKIEENESPINAVVREVKEETGLDSAPEDYTHFAEMVGAEYNVQCYFSSKLNISEAKQLTNEELFVIYEDDLKWWNIFPNLNFLVPLSKYRGFSFTTFYDGTYTLPTI